jgi:hypothetical protein
MCLRLKLIKSLGQPVQTRQLGHLCVEKKRSTKMNKKIVEGKWEQFKAKVKSKERSMKKAFKSLFHTNQ